MDLVTTQLQTFEAEIDAKIREWTAPTVWGCQEMEERVDALESIRE